MCFLKQQFGYCILENFDGKVMAVSICLRPGFLSSHALETSPCLSTHRCCQARGQDEDEMALPQKIPLDVSNAHWIF